MKAYLKAALVLLGGLSTALGAVEEKAPVQQQEQNPAQPQEQAQESMQNKTEGQGQDQQEQKQLEKEQARAVATQSEATKEEKLKAWWECETKNTAQKIQRGEITPLYTLVHKPEALDPVILSKARELIAEVLAEREKLIDMLSTITNADQVQAVTPELAKRARGLNTLRVKVALDLKLMGIRFDSARSVYSFGEEEDRARAIYVSLIKEKKRLARESFFKDAALLALLLYEFPTKDIWREAPPTASFSGGEGHEIRKLMEENNELIKRCTGAIGGPGLTRDTAWIIPITDGKNYKEQLKELEEKIRLICLLVGSNQPYFELAGWNFGHRLYLKTSVVIAEQLRHFNLWFKTSPEIGLPVIYGSISNTDERRGFRHLHDLFPMVE